jgi:hypothetical protein
MGQQSMVVGIIEFEEKTSIGQENAGVIIPEILINHLKNIGRYKLAERVLLQTALEEQELQMSGVTDQGSAAKLGQVFGLDAFIVGSAMKVGKKISITGRVIATESAEIITTGTVEFANLKHLDAELEELAYQLSGYPEREYRKIQFVQEISKNTLGGAAGAGYAYDIDFSIGNFVYGGNIFFKNRYLDFAFLGLGSFDFKYGSMNALLTGYPIPRLGIGAGWSWANYMMPDSYKFTLGKEYYDYQYHALLYGISYRISADLTIGLYQGPALAGGMYYQSESETVNSDYYPLKPIWIVFTGSPMISFIEYSFLDNWVAKLMSIRLAARADTTEFYRSQSMLFILQVGYSYSF